MLNELMIIATMVNDAQEHGKIAIGTVAIDGIPNEDGKKYTDYISVRFFSEEMKKQALSKAKKGTTFLFVGKISQSSYTKQDGSTAYETYMTVNNMMPASLQSGCVVNSLILQGTVVADATEHGSIAMSRVAVKGYKYSDGEEHTDFVSIRFFGKNKDFALAQIRKGRTFNLVGKISSSKYTNNEGKNVYETYMTVNKVEFSYATDKSKATATDDFSQIDEMDTPFR